MLKEKVIALIKEKRLYSTIASRMGCSESTIRRWVYSNDRTLTTHDALIILSEILDMKVDSMLTKRIKKEPA